MKIGSKLGPGFLIVSLSVAILPTSLVLAGEEQCFDARSSGTLGQAVMRSITRIQELMTPEDPDDEPDLVRAKLELDELRERRFQRMNDFEKATLLNFYTNYYLTIEDYQGAIRSFEEILTIEALRGDTRLRTLRSLGQLYTAEEQWRPSIANYVAWRDCSFDEDDIVYRGLSYAHYQLDEHAEAVPYWEAYMEFKLAAGEPLNRDDYAYLNGLYFTIEDWDKSLDLTKTMIVLFDNPTDRRNLDAVNAMIANPRLLEAQNLETINSPNGDTYVGELRDNLPNGQGIYTYSDGAKYSGGFVNGKRNGLGTFTFANGRVRDGLWENDEYRGGN